MDDQYSNPLLSIIIPTFNSGKNLEVVLKSIFEQSFKDLEVLIVDGDSKDDTLEVAEEYKKSNTNLRITSEADKGIYDAMNKGLKLAQGDWLYFMGSDDSFYDSNVLEKFANYDGLGEIEVLYGNVYASGFGGIYDGSFTYTKLSRKNICHQSIFINKKVFNIIGGFNVKYKALADWDHNIRWFFSSKIKNQYIDLTIANYCEGGFSSKYIDRKFYEDKNWKLLCLGIGKISLPELINITDNAILYARLNHKPTSVGLWFIVKQIFNIYRHFDKTGKE